MSVQAFAPATVANLGPGFDVLGLALAGRGDTVIARKRGTGPLSLSAIHGDGGQLPRDVERNTAGVAAAATLRKAGLDPGRCGITIELHKGLPIGSGLGSSAASAAAAAAAVNQLVGNPLRRMELVEPCIEAEAVVSGRHADNVAPALIGGLVLVRSIDPLDLVRLPVPEGLQVVVCLPDFVLETRRAREAVPREVPLAALVQNSANVAAFVAACHAGDLALLGRTIADAVAAPARAALVPGAEAAMEAALGVGALGSSICGAGPSVFALCHSQVVAEAARAAMVETFGAAGLRAEAFVSPADAPGVRARVVEEEA